MTLSSKYQITIMNAAFLKKLINFPRYLISGTELNIMLPGSQDAKKSIIKRAVHAGYLKRLKRDFYLIYQIPNKPIINTFECAQFVYGPSYISFESALSQHGWIPERVTTTCSATIKQKKTFHSPIGIFHFEKIPNATAPLGVFYTTEGEAKYLMASPWKAIADIIYCRKKNWSTLSDLMLDLRIEVESIQEEPLDILSELASTYPHKKTKSILKHLLKGAKDVSR